MRKSNLIAGLGLPLFITLFGMAFSTGQNPESIITDRFQIRQDSFIKAANAFKSAAQTRNITITRAAYRNLRTAFKAWEYLGEFRHPSLVRDHFNGAPLSKPEDNAFGAVILQPRGLQVIDEIMGDPEQDSAWEKLTILSVQLSETANALPPVTICYDHEIFEAARMEIIRLFTLGLTGFDTPGTSAAIQDALTSLITLESDINLFTDADRVRPSAAADSLRMAFQRGRKMLSQNSDFDAFDRATFLRSVVNPIFKSLKDLQMQLEIPFPHEVRNTPMAVNYQAEHIFGGDFLNPGYYSGLPEAFRTTAVKELGMLLFFDPILSSNNQRACAGCHAPEKAFTDGRPKSLAMEMKGTVERNSPTLINCIFSERFFHDLRAEALEDQMTHVIADSREFNTDIHHIIDKLKMSNEYVSLFSKAFTNYPGDPVNPQTIGFAISAYVGSLNAFNSDFDRFARGETNTLNPDAIRGFNLFMGKAACGTCHFAPLFSGTVPPDFTESESEVLGVPQQWPAKKPAADKDPGRGAARIKDQLPIYQFSFKTPTLRNIELTGPYMHNGSMNSLESVMDFYNRGGGNGIGLHFAHQTLSSEKLGLKPREIRQIIAFMKSLTDFKTLSAKPARLPAFRDSLTNLRPVGGLY